MIAQIYAPIAARLLILILVIDSFETLSLSMKEQSLMTVTECLMQVIRPHADSLIKVSLHYSLSYDHVASELLGRMTSPVVINTIEYPLRMGPDVRVQTDLVVILDEDLQISAILNETLWNADTRFLLALEAKDDLQEIFRSFWTYRAVNVFGFLWENDSFTVYSYMPYRPKNPSSSFFSAVRVDSETREAAVGTYTFYGLRENICDSGDAVIIDQWTRGKFQSGGISKIWDESRVDDVHGCPLNVSIVNVKPNVMFVDEFNNNTSKHVDGVEGRLMLEIVKKLNFTATYMIPRDGVGWGWIHPSPSGVAGDVFTGQSDFGFGLLGTTTERYENLDVSLPFTPMECLTCGLPKGAGKKKPTWINLLVFEYSPLTWSLIIISFGGISLILCRSKNLLSKSESAETNSHLVLYVFSSCLGVPVKIPRGGIFRIVFATWVCFCFVLTVGYQASMGSQLTVPTPDPDINTFKQLLESDLTLTGYNNMLRTMIGQQDRYIQAMVKRFSVTDFDIDYAVDYIASERKIAHIRHSTTFLYYSLISTKAKGNVHVLNDCVYIYYPIIVIRRRSPLTNRVNRIITSLFQAGIIKFWKTDYIYDVPPPPRTFVQLTVNHMLGAIFLFGVGCGISLLLFLGELYHYYFHKINIQLWGGCKPPKYFKCCIPRKKIKNYDQIKPEQIKK